MSELGVAIRPKAGVLCVVCKRSELGPAEAPQPRRGQVGAAAVHLGVSVRVRIRRAYPRPRRYVRQTLLIKIVVGGGPGLVAVRGNGLRQTRASQRGPGQTVAGLTTAGCARSTPVVTRAAAALLPSPGGCAPAAAPRLRLHISLRQRTIAGQCGKQQEEAEQAGRQRLQLAGGPSLLA